MVHLHRSSGEPQTTNRRHPLQRHGKPGVRRPVRPRPSSCGVAPYAAPWMEREHNPGRIEQNRQNVQNTPAATHPWKPHWPVVVVGLPESLGAKRTAPRSLPDDSPILSRNHGSCDKSRNPCKSTSLKVDFLPGLTPEHPDI